MNFDNKIRESFFAKLLIVIIVIWIALAVVFGFTDLHLSIVVVDQTSFLGIFGADFGETSGWVVIGISISILIGGSIKDVKKQKLGGLPVILIVLILGIDSLFDDGSQDVMNYFSMVACIAIFSIVTINKDWREYRIIAGIIVILVIVNVLIFVQVTKILWGRVRFRDLLLDYSNFSPWFVPQGITGNQSFPSGHTAMGFMLLPLLILLKDRDIRDPTRIVMTGIIIGWGLFVAISRIVIGAHFASDVLFSAGMATIITVLLYHMFYLRRKS